MHRCKCSNREAINEPFEEKLLALFFRNATQNVESEVDDDLRDNLRCS